MKLSITLNKYILLTAVILITLGFGVSGIILVSVQKILFVDHELERASEFAIVAQDAKFHLVQVQQFLTDASLTRESDSIREAKNNLQTLDKDLDHLNKIYSQYGDEIEKIRLKSRKMAEVGLEMTKAYWQKGFEAGNEVMKRPQDGLDVMSEQVTTVIEELINKAEKQRQEASTTLENTIKNLSDQGMILLALLILTTVVVFIFLFIRLKPLNNINAQLFQNAEYLTSASEGMRQNAEAMAEANTRQASATQETAASLEEINSMVARTAENSEKLKEGSEASHKLVNLGKEKLHDVQERMQEIEKEIKNLVEGMAAGNKDILSIIGIISEIGSKTKVINDIVFQTKLLSFNASVEAARAGEHGKGFSVVAEEVGNLANVSGEAAKEISTMLNQGINEVERIVKSSAERVEDSIKLNQDKIKGGVQAAHLCQETFNEIIEQVNDVKNVSSEITAAINEQRKGLDEISRAITSLDLATQSNVRISDTMKEGSDSLSQSVQELDSTIDQITQIILGGQSKGSPASYSLHSNSGPEESLNNKTRENSTPRLAS